MSCGESLVVELETCFFLARGWDMALLIRLLFVSLLFTALLGVPVLGLNEQRLHDSAALVSNTEF